MIVPHLLMLEDDEERIVRFATCVNSMNTKLEMRIWRDAYQMIREATALLPSALLISLDHDLEPENEGNDPGDGYMIAQWLTSQPIVRPVIIHSSNRERSTWMAGAFELAEWQHYLVAPIGDDWIEVDWRNMVRKLIKQAKPSIT